MTDKPQWRPCPDSHDLEPIENWAGRYRCTLCGVVCYRGYQIVPKFRDRRWVSYKCPKCHGPTTGKTKVCPACRKDDG